LKHNINENPATIGINNHTTTQNRGGSMVCSNNMSANFLVPMAHNYKFKSRHKKTLEIKDPNI